jgi:predicted ATP-binding protein involved in virulence
MNNQMKLFINLKIYYDCFGLKHSSFIRILNFLNSNMFLKNIKLIDFRGLNLQLSFDDNAGKIRPVSVVIGENGVGKSNLLKAIALITAGSEALGSFIGSPDEWISFGKESCEIVATLLNQEREERIISLKINRGDSFKDIIFNNVESLNEIDNAFKLESRDYFVVAYGISRRPNVNSKFNPSNEKERHINKNRSIVSLFNPEAQLHPLPTWAMELDYKSDNVKLNDIEEVLNDLLIGIRFKEIDKANDDILFSVGKEIVPLSLLGEGYQNVIAWIGDLLYQITSTFANYQSPLEVRGLLLIDEIDSHLHPKWQRLLLKYIKSKFPKLQLITTTHSAIVAQQTKRGELYFLNKDEFGIVHLDIFQGNPNELLIHQMLLSPAFGLLSDESLHVQELKQEYREIKMRKSPDSRDEKRLKEISTALNAVPATLRSNYVADPNQLAIIQEVRLELLNRKHK